MGRASRVSLSARPLGLSVRLPLPVVLPRVHPLLRILTLVAPVAGGTAVLVWRFRETRTAVTVRKIVVPPLAMSTGFGMFVVEAMRIPWVWGIAAFLVGSVVLAVPLDRTSVLERRGDEIFLRRSPWFLAILLALLGLRLALHDYVGHLVTAGQTASLFFVLAFGMISRWRTEMYLRFRALSSAPSGCARPPGSV